MGLNIYDILQCLYVTGKLLGMSPYRMLHYKNKRTCKVNKSKIMNLILLVGVASCMIGCNIMYRKQNVEATTSGVLIQFTHNLKILSAILTMLLIWFNQDKFVTSFHKVNNFDKKIKKIDSSLNLLYALSLFLAIFTLLLCFAAPITLAVLDRIKNNTAYHVIIYESFSNGLQFMIHCYVVLYFNLLVLLLYIRLSYLHYVLRCFQDPIERQSHIDHPITVLNLACGMYEDLCYAANIFNKVVSFSLFSIVILNMLESLLISYVFISESVVDIKLIMYGIFNTLLVIFLLFPTGFLHRKSTGMAKYLTESSICYQDQTMATIRNTFMLQTLQHGIEFNACGFFTLSMSAFVDEMGTCISLLLFLFQLVNWNKTDVK